LDDLCDFVNHDWAGTCDFGRFASVRGRDYVLQKLLQLSPEELAAAGLLRDD
jgi:hypothetical protein